jgi:hypothetical protein
LDYAHGSERRQTKGILQAITIKSAVVFRRVFLRQIKKAVMKEYVANFV